jgi:ABC-2 type transport system ATP-binding protein
MHAPRATAAPASRPVEIRRYQLGGIDLMIEVEGLTRYYGTLAAVRDVSFSVDEHAVVGLLGLNGAGKSTILKVLSGMMLPSAGSVRIDGVDVTDSPDSLRSSIGYLPEEPPLYSDMRVHEFLHWSGQLRGADRADLAGRVDEVIEQCQLEEVRDKLVENLSHGFRKRVGIAQAIVHDPRLVILDEPISGLDPVQIVEMRDVVRQLGERRTVLISSHILSEISQTCDRILVIHRGQLVAQGTEEELFARVEQSSRVTITVRGTRDELDRHLSEAPRVLHHTIDRAQEGLVVATIDLDEDAREELVRGLVEADFGLRRLEESAAELEQVFLGLTRDDAESEKSTESSDGTAPDDEDFAETSTDREEEE